MSPNSAGLAALTLYTLVTLAIVLRGARRTADCWETWVLVIVAKLYSGFYFGLRLRPPCAVPRGGALLIANHRSPVDPLLIVAALGRRRDDPRFRLVEFLTASEYVSMPGVIGWICRCMRSIPVDRDGRDTEPAKEALRRVKAGHIVGIFPEGKINFGSGLLPASPGVAWLALRAGQPVIPVFVHGAPQSRNMVEPFCTPARVRVDFGQPVDLSMYAGIRTTPTVLAEVTHLLMCALAETGGLSLVSKPSLPQDGDRVSA